jgi:hypothetical protein
MCLSGQDEKVVLGPVDSDHRDIVALCEQAFGK